MAIVQRVEGFHLSTFPFYKDWHRQLSALKELVEVPMIVLLIPYEFTVESIGLMLRELLGKMWRPNRRNTRNKSPRIRRHATKQKGAHTSVQRRRETANSKAGP